MAWLLAALVGSGAVTGSFSAQRSNYGSQGGKVVACPCRRGSLQKQGSLNKWNPSKIDASVTTMPLHVSSVTTSESGVFLDWPVK